MLPWKVESKQLHNEISENETVDKLPIQPIVSNIGTATYDLAKYLAKLLSPLSQSEYIIKNTKQLVEQIRMKQAPGGYKMVSLMYPLKKRSKLP